MLQELRKKYPKALLPIILVSARNTTEDVVQGFSYGCNDYVTKPYQKAELLARIRTQLYSKESFERSQLQADMGNATAELKQKLDAIALMLTGTKSDVSSEEVGVGALCLSSICWTTKMICVSICSCTHADGGQTKGGAE